MNDAEVPSTIPKNQIRKFLSDQFCANIPDKNLRDFLLTNLILNGDDADESFSWKANVEVLLSDLESISFFPDFEESQFLKNTLFVKGENSDYIKWERDGERILSLFPLATLETVQNVGHWLHAEKPKQFVSICEKFLIDDKSKSFHHI